MKKQIRYFMLTALLLAISGGAYGAVKTVPLGEVAAELKNARPGDELIIKNGTYSDTELRWTGRGTAEKPIIIRAEAPGKVNIEGVSSLHLAGEWVEVSGLMFTNGYTRTNSVIEYRNGGEVANNCRITDCVIEGFNPPARETGYSSVILYGRNNRFDHNVLSGKLNFGVTLIVMLNEERSQQNFHRIDHNYFGPRPVYGSNGAETIRVGNSQYAHTSSNTIIEDNVFEKCDGEVEVISIKSSDNIIRRNTFIRCQGVLALRHGDRNIAEGNVFLGYGERNTGGIRVVNAGHKVTGNFFYQLAGGRFFSALALMNAVPNSLPNRYCLVEDVEVTGNTFIECSNIEFGTGRDLERTLPPERILFADNIIVNRGAREPFAALDDISGFTFRNNKVELAVKTNIKGFSNGVKKIPALPSEAALREGKGSSWYVTQMEMFEYPMREHLVGAGDDLAAVIDRSNPGDWVILTDAGGDYAIQRALAVRHTLVIAAADGVSARPVIRFNGQRKDNMITIESGGQLLLRGVAFSGHVQDGRSGAAAGISTAPKMIEPYTLTVENCEFFEFGEGGFFAVKGTKNTFAEKVVIKNSIFRNLSGDAINFAAERDDIGRYNADDVIIEDCSFFRILGIGINIYRGGSDESTAGPYVHISNCNFEDVCNKERGAAMRLIGPQVMTVKGCAFSNSGRGGASIRLDEATWEKISIAECNFWNSGRIVTMTEKVVDGPLYDICPEYIDEANYDFRMRPGSRLAEMGIGIK